jgi:hypothetical protein
MHIGYQKNQAENYWKLFIRTVKSIWQQQKGCQFILEESDVLEMKKRAAPFTPTAMISMNLPCLEMENGLALLRRLLTLVHVIFTMNEKRDNKSLEHSAVMPDGKLNAVRMNRRHG